MKLSRLWMVLLLLVLGAVPALAEDYSHPSGFAFSVPDNWQVANKGNNVLTATDPSGLVSFVFTAPANDDVSAVAGSIDSELQKIMKDYRQSDLSSTELNGLKVFTSTIEGNVNGVKLTGLVYAFVNNKGRIMLVFAFVPSDYYSQQESKVVQILSTIRGK